MNQEYIKLYQRIKDFQIDDRHAKFTFSQKLAKENRWSAEYTQRAIEEYKKFAFLAVVAGHPVTPSEQVDRVWHMHLLSSGGGGVGYGGCDAISFSNSNVFAIG